MLSSDFFRNWNPDFFRFLEKSKSRLLACVARES